MTQWTKTGIIICLIILCTVSATVQQEKSRKKNVGKKERENSTLGRSISINRGRKRTKIVLGNHTRIIEEINKRPDYDYSVDPFASAEAITHPSQPQVVVKTVEKTEIINPTDDNSESEGNDPLKINVSKKSTDNSQITSSKPKKEFDRLSGRSLYNPALLSSIESSETPPEDNLLRSDRKIFDHVHWGSIHTQVYTGGKHRTDRIYHGFGECPRKGHNVNYDTEINEVDEIQPILMAYAEMFRVYCNKDTVATLNGLFEKGYARLEMDHSVAFSEHALIFIKQNITSIEEEDMEALIELSAFSQVYVSWYTHPVASIDPTGAQIKDSSFIEVVGRLHALDLVKFAAKAKRHVTEIADAMVVKLKTALREMRDTLRNIHGDSKASLRRKSVQTDSLAVTLGLADFLMRKDAPMIHILEDEEECAHEVFKKFYTPKRSRYVELAKKLGKRPMEEDED